MNIKTEVINHSSIPEAKEKFSKFNSGQVVDVISTWNTTVVAYIENEKQI